MVAPAYDAYGAPPSSKYGRPAAPPAFEEDAFGRTTRYRELPSHRMPQYEDEDLSKRRNPRGGATREVILQRADEWSDPWMRSKSPGREKRGGARGRDRARSYSNSSSYSSSSSSSRSGSSSESSRSPSPSAPTRRARYDSHRSKDSDRHGASVGGGGGGAAHIRKVIRTRSPSISPRRGKCAS